MKEQVEFAASWEQYLNRNTRGYVNMQIRVMLRSESRITVLVSFWSERAQIGNSNPRLNIYTKPSAENHSGTRSRLILNVFVQSETSWQITGLNYLSKLSFPRRLMQNRKIDKANERDRMLFIYVQVATSCRNKKKERNY